MHTKAITEYSFGREVIFAIHNHKKPKMTTFSHDILFTLHYYITYLLT